MVKFYIGLLVVLVVVSCKTDSPRVSKNVFRYNESKGIATLDPAFARNEVLMRPVSQLFNGLLELDDSLNVVPCIARRWEKSANGLEYKFILRNDVFFHDHPLFPNGKGRKVVASDFVFSFRRILDSKVASPGRWVFNSVDSLNPFTALNDSVLVVKLSANFPAFAGLLTMPYCFVVPKEVVEYYGADFRSHPIGTGPFMFKAWREGEKLVLIRNPNYFEFDRQQYRLPYLDGVAVTFIKDKQSEFLEFMKGNVDYLDGVNPAYSNELFTRTGSLAAKYSDRFVLDKHPYLNTEYIGVLLDKDKASCKALLNNKVRLALNFGFDRAKMLKYLRNGIGEPAYWGIVPRGMPGFVETDEHYSYNPDLARRYLSEAGFPDGKNLPEITLTTNPDYLDLCEFIQHDLSIIGFKIKIEVSTGATFREMVANCRLPLFRNSWIADYPDAQNYFALFYSKNFCPQGSNYTHFVSDQYDALYEEAEVSNSEKHRFELYKKMTRLLLMEAPVVPLFYSTAVRVFPKNIVGLKGNAINSLKIKYVKKVSDNKP
jgi:oligopeptide transport system substrate-binding protein